MLPEWSSFPRSCLAAILLTVLSMVQAFPQQNTLRFIRLTSREGLSQDHVSATIKDKKGFMWFATDEGLNKYDGYEFTAFKHDPSYDSSISSNFVLDVLEDQDGNLWVGTLAGLDLFNRDNNTFSHFAPKEGPISVRDLFIDDQQYMWIGTTTGLYKFDRAQRRFVWHISNNGASPSLSDDFVYRIGQGPGGELWIGTREGVTVIDPEKQTSHIYGLDNRNGLRASRIKTVYRDSKGNMWLGTQGGGLSRYDKASDSFRTFVSDPKNKNSLAHNDVLSLAESASGELWVGTENGGLSIMDYATFSFRTYAYEATNPASISNNSVYSLYKDDTGTMWAGTWSGGVNMIPVNPEKFAHFTQVPGGSSLGNNLVLSITGDEDGYIWIGTDGAGVNRFDPKTKTFTQYVHDEKSPRTIAGNFVMTVKEIAPNVLGIGYHRSGFDLYNTKTGQIFHHMPEYNAAASVTGMSAHVLFKDRDNYLWVGSHDRSGLFRYKLDELYSDRKASYRHYANVPNDEGTIAGNIVYCLYEDREGNLWAGTDGGLELYDREHDQFIHHRAQPGKPDAISSNIVYSILEDAQGNLWIATGGGGLNFYDRKEKTFRAFTEKDGLANNVIFGILPDHRGNLWFSSNKGISRFDPKTKLVRNFSIADGLQGYLFKPNAYFKSSDGTMYFGGTNGFNVFRPEQIVDNPVAPPVWITGLQIFNKPVHSSEDGPLNKEITEASSVVVSHDQSVITFEFAALNFLSPEKNQYAYKLDGFDKQWNYAGSHRLATYTNLDPGEYTFRVKASNNDGVWNEQGTSIALIVTPPFWKTLSFQILAAMLVVGGAFGFYKMRINTIQKQKDKLKRKVKKRTAKIVRQNAAIEQQAKEIAAINQNLEWLVKQRTSELERKNKALQDYAFINAHKLRGPLASILGLVDLITREPLSGDAKMLFEHLKDSAVKLDDIIHAITKAIEQAEKAKEAAGYTEEETVEEDERGE